MEIIYLKAVVDFDIPKLDKSSARKIKISIENKLGKNPMLFGLPLRGTLKSFWKLRVGDYRVVYTIYKNKVIIVLIAHRKEVYKKIDNRI